MSNKYIIVDVHPKDAFYEDLKYLEGQAVISSDDFQPSTCGDSGYIAGTFYFPSKIKIGKEYADCVVFYAVQLQTIEDNLAENGNVVYAVADQ